MRYMHIFLIFVGVFVVFFPKLISFFRNTIFQWNSHLGCESICHHLVESENALGQMSESDLSFHVQGTIVHIHACMDIYMFADSNIIMKYMYTVIAFS